jgi:hypothetical protein
MSRLADQLPRSRLGAPGHLTKNCGDIWDVVQNPETGDQIKSIVGKGHSPVGIGLDVLELWVSEFTRGLEHRNLLGSIKNGLYFIPEGASETKDVLES